MPSMSICTQRCQSTLTQQSLVSRLCIDPAMSAQLEAMQAHQLLLTRSTLEALLEKARCRLEVLGVEEISPGMLPGYFRAAFIAEVATSGDSRIAC